MKKFDIVVHMHIKGQFVPAGKLTYIDDASKSHCEFIYFDEYINNILAIPVDPVQLPLQEGLYITNSDSEYFNGIRDSCPDSWGDHLLESAAKKFNIKLKEIDYILYAGSDRIGALGFSTKIDQAPFSENPLWAQNIVGEDLSLEELDLATQKITNSEELPYHLRRFFERGSSVGGARPKASCVVNNVPYLAKFQHPDDKWPICRLEDACMYLAKKCGCNVANSSRISFFGGSRDIYLTQRFDRRIKNKITYRIPFASEMTICNLNELAVCGNYLDFVKMMDSDLYDQTKSKEDKIELFKRIVFNALINNTDDHPRNHAFLFGENGWYLSPAYDLTPIKKKSKISESNQKIGVYGNIFTKENIISQSHFFGLKQNEAGYIFDQMQNLVQAEWQNAFLSCGIFQRYIDEIAESLPLVTNNYQTM